MRKILQIEKLTSNKFHIEHNTLFTIYYIIILIQYIELKIKMKKIIHHKLITLFVIYLLFKMVL
jgi:hypothetical protein